MARLILDTGVLVACARGRLSFTAAVGDDDVALPDQLPGVATRLVSTMR